ncbi:hypothetical protein H4582DRAFT_1525873 [Lactarius indigo]|nr:hypothetical protein H4582DRAFT_1525873 [Lactarius indigo]
MVTITSRPSTTSAKIRSKTSELSKLFRGRQHSSIPSPSTDPSNKSKRKIPLFSLRKKSPVAPLGHRSPTHTPVPTPRPSTNAYVLRLLILSIPTSHVFSSLQCAEHPQSETQLGHSFRSSPSPQHPFPHCLHSKTCRLPNVPRFHLRTRDPRGLRRVHPLPSLLMV